MNDEVIKVCGMRDAENIREVEALGVDWMGFIFWPKSSRYVSKQPDYLPRKVKRVGVFVDATVDDMLQHVAAFGLDLIQLHGHETPADIDNLRHCLENCATAPRCRVGCGIAATPHADSTVPRLVKAFNIATPADLDATQPYEGLVDYFLFDTKGHSVGGNGEKFDWSVLSSYKGHTPFLLSGGIGPDDAGRVKDFHHEKCIGIDVNSCFESSPAVKDIEKLRRFINEVKQ